MLAIGVWQSDWETNARIAVIVLLTTGWTVTSLPGFSQGTMR